MLTILSVTIETLRYVKQMNLIHRDIFFLFKLLYKCDNDCAPKKFSLTLHPATICPVDILSDDALPAKTELVITPY